MKRHALFLSLVLLLAAAPAFANQRAGIAATVNDEVITFSDINNRIGLYLAGAPSRPPPEVLSQMREQVLDRLINEKLQISEAKSLGITVTEDQIAEGFAQIARQNNRPPEDFRKVLRQGGVNTSTLDDQLRAEIAWGQVVRRKLRPQISVSESEIDTEMDMITRNSKKPQYHVAEIFLAVPSPAMDASVRQDAEKLAQQILKGAKFSEVAREFSQAPGAAAGGDLGWIQEGQIDPALGEVVSKMSIGQLSRPVRTDSGYHILFLRDVRKPRGTTVAAAPAAPPSSSTPGTVHLWQIALPVDATDPAVITAAKTARLHALKSEISSCADMAAKAADFPGPDTRDLGEQSIMSLSPNIRAAVTDLPVGELSTPVGLDGAYAVLMVCARSDGADDEVALSGDADEAVPEGEREQVASQIGSRRLDQMQDRYLRDLRATAFIEKRL